MPVVHGYVRVSTVDQADNGRSLEAQRQTVLREFDARWKAEGFAFGHVYEDRAESGGKPFLCRKAGTRLTLDLSRGDVVIFPKLDRGFRSTEDMLATVRVWKARGVRAVFLDVAIDTDTPTGELMLTVLGSFATFERRRIGERTKAGLAVAMAAGKLPGQPPFCCTRLGVRPNTYFQVDPTLLKVGQTIIDWKGKGHSYGRIARHLNDLGIRRQNKDRSVFSTARFSRWNESSVQRAYVQTLRVLQWLATNHPRVRMAPTGLPKPKEDASGAAGVRGGEALPGHPEDGGRGDALRLAGG